MLIILNIVTIEHEKVLLGANFTSHNTLKEFCMGLFEESNDSLLSGNLLAIYIMRISFFLQVHLTASRLGFPDIQS
jgi:hypothetical protein